MYLLESGSRSSAVRHDVRRSVGGSDYCMGANVALLWLVQESNGQITMRCQLIEAYGRRGTAVIRRKSQRSSRITRVSKGVLEQRLRGSNAGVKSLKGNETRRGRPVEGWGLGASDPNGKTRGSKANEPISLFALSHPKIMPVNLPFKALPTL